MWSLTEKPDQPGSSPTQVCRIQGQVGQPARDSLAIEEPLEIRLEHGPLHARLKQSISITMRTPGYDFELAVGFLFTEGIVARASDIFEVQYCGPDLRANPITNIVRVELRPEVVVDLKKLSRHFYTTSSCGVCGKSSLEALRSRLAVFTPGF